MCYCCCISRKGITIYMMVISIIAFIYGIVAMSYFGSSTKIYKAFKKKLDSMESSRGSSEYDYLRRLYPYGYPYSTTTAYNSEYQELAKDILDSISLEYINNLNSTKSQSTSVIGNLKAIENALGVILFVFPIIFFVAEIVFLVFSCGDKEFTPLSGTTFKVLNAIKIICLTFSIIFIFLSILYGNLLAVALYQYMALVPNTDRCVIGIIIGMVFGYYSFWYYITLSSGFSKERALFLLVGSVENPGIGARFDANGNPIAPVAQTVNQPSQPITYSNAQQVNNGVIPINQIQNAYQPLSLNSKDEDFIFYNGMIYKKVGNAKNITSVDINNIQNVPNNEKPNAEQNVEIKVNPSQPPANNEK